jgi:hypothetical protein
MKIAEKEQRKNEKFARGKNPASKKNLKLFKAGESGNPDGKPEGTLDFKTRLARKLERVAPEFIKDIDEVAQFCTGLATITTGDALDSVLLYKAIVQKDLMAIKEIFDRSEGKVKTAVELTGAGGSKLIPEPEAKIVIHLPYNFRDPLPENVNIMIDKPVGD